ncbi:MAG: hypothetical protein D6705_17095 [Deltaproteobacteria bacterium]|nr:MAG: hypothetical protein D6705_17095 [Deltaproteobacteria bacterium]
MVGPPIAAGPVPSAPRLSAAKRDRRQPFRRGDGPVRALVLHGLSGSPHEVRPFAEALADLGLAVDVPLLPGHDDVEALARVGADEWLDAARAAFDRLADGASHVAVVGFSMGALLTLCLCAERAPSIRAAVCAGTPLELAPSSQVAVDGLRRLHAAIPGAHPFAPVAKGLPDVRLASEAVSNPGVMAFPTTALAALADLQARARAALDRIRCPLGLLHGLHDHTAPVTNVDTVAAQASSPRIETRILPESFHLVGVDLEAPAAIRFVRDFVQRHVLAPTHEPPYQEPSA